MKTWLIIVVTIIVLIVLALVGFLIWWFLPKSTTSSSSSTNNMTNTRQANLSSAQVVTGSNIVGALCDVDSDCANSACGREYYDPELEKTCCKSGETIRSPPLIGYDYCTQMLNGYPCRTDSMCASQYCDGGGITTGRCANKPVSTA